MEKRSDKMKENFRKMKMPGMKARYLRLDRFLRMTDNLDQQPYCNECHSLANESEKLSGMTLQTDKEFQDFEIKYMDLFGKINEHLKTYHGYRIPNFFVSLYTLIYTMVGTLTGIFFVYLGRAGNFGKWSYEVGGLLGFVAGLIIGRISGHRKDKQMAIEHKTLY